MAAEKFTHLVFSPYFRNYWEFRGQYFYSSTVSISDTMVLKVAIQILCLHGQQAKEKLFPTFLNLELQRSRIIEA